MKGLIKGFIYSPIDKKTTVELTLDGSQCEELEKYQDCEVEVKIKKYYNKRSLDANRYFWALLDRLAVTMNLSKEEMYRGYIRQIGGNNDIVCVQDKAVDKLCKGWHNNGLGWITDTMPSKIEGCTNAILYYGSSTYDTTQMSRLIDLVVQDCKSVGIETLTPEKLAGLMDEWGR